MIPAFLATFGFALSTVCGHRATRLIGGIETNFWRLVVALLLLGAWAHGFGSGLAGNAFPIFIVSGFIGIGIGDVALYQALPRLGSRLTSLLLQCLTTAFAIAIEWLWLGTRLTTAELACGAVILGGVVIALRPRERLHFPGRLAPGLVFTTVGAFGNALGMVLSRKAYAVAAVAGQSIDGGTAAYQRVIGGLLLSGCFLLVAKRRAIANHVREPDFSTQPAGKKWRTAWLWVLANGTFGMAVGVSCVQWALKTSPTGIVQSVLSVTPLAVIPLARIMEGERPSRGAWLGGIIAVGGTIALTWFHLDR